MSGRTDVGIDDLFASARGDQPSAEVTEDVWRKVSAAAVPAGASVASATASKAAVVSKTAAASGSYGAAFGVLFGAAGAALLMHVAGAFDGPPPHLGAGARPGPARVVLAKGAGAATLDDAPARGRADAPPPPAVETVPAARAMPPKAAAADDGASSLAREARLVTDARQALLGGEPARALELLREARSLTARALEPEEVRLEARALRALGRTDEALELDLRRRSEH